MTMNSQGPINDAQLTMVNATDIRSISRCLRRVEAKHRVGVRAGIALPLVLGVVLCLGLWVAVLSQTMTQSRESSVRMIKMKRAYYLARSALQHFLLKVKHADRVNPRVIEAVCAPDPSADTGSGIREVRPANSRAKTLAEMFVDDIRTPPAPGGQLTRGSYGVKSFLISAINNQEMAVEITALGTCDEVTDTIRRVYRISR